MNRDTAKGGRRRAAPNSPPPPVHPEASSEAKRVAAAVLEVLAGMRGPCEAAQVLGISLARYYQLENRALDGLLAACEPRRRGRGQGGPTELATLRRECERLRRECARQQALVRAAQKTVGFTPPPPEPADEPSGSGRKRRRRRPRARALRAAALLREEQPPPAEMAPAVQAETASAAAEV